jgi:thiamine-phosphate pyrophosphorylase
MRIARMTGQVARSAGVLFVVNDRLDVALAVGADAVHLGQGDLPLADARRILAAQHSDMLVGISTHDADQVRAAVDGGADYLGFGPVYQTTTKVNPDPVRGIDRLAEAVKLAGDTPVVAIGGITPERAAAVAATGVAAACAISSVNNAVDVVAAGRELARHWSAPR